MRIRRISIRNFRGIRQFDWNVPDNSLFCLIGRGDSTKSTILEALRRAFYPQWNLAFDDADFFECKPTNAICIDVILGDIPDQFRDLETYGHHLCGWSSQALTRHDEPGDGLEDALHVRLGVRDDLEPSWRVIRADADEGIAFRHVDRAHVSVSLLGALSDRHLTWSRGSLLSRLTDTDSLSLTLADASRAAKAALEGHRDQSLSRFDAIAQKAEATARSLGVNVAANYKAHLDANALNVRLGGLALHDGEMPLRQLGLGSKRMLTTGLQTQTLRAPHVTLFDGSRLPDAGLIFSRNGPPSRRGSCCMRGCPRAASSVGLCGCEEAGNEGHEGRLAGRRTCAEHVAVESAHGRLAVPLSPRQLVGASSAATVGPAGSLAERWVWPPRQHPGPPRRRETTRVPATAPPR